jgi:hypothetical protein
MPKNGTAKKTEIASAVVVDKEPVGASYHGKMIQIFAVPINRNKVPMKPIYSSG